MHSIWLVELHYRNTNGSEDREIMRRAFQHQRDADIWRRQHTTPPGNMVIYHRILNVAFTE